MIELENYLFEAKKNIDELKHDTPSLSEDQKEMELYNTLAFQIVEDKIEAQLTQGKLSK